MLEYIELLNTACIFYKKETSQLATNQSTIHSWIDRCSSIAQRVRSNPRQHNPTMSDSSHSDSTQECEFEWQPQSWIDRYGSIAQRVQSRQRTTLTLLDTMSESTSGSDSTWESESTRESDSDWEVLQQTNVQRDAAQKTQVQRDDQSMTEQIIWDTGD